MVAGPSRPTVRSSKDPESSIMEVTLMRVA